MTTTEQEGQRTTQPSDKNLFMKQNQFSVLSESELPLLKGHSQHIGNDDTVLISKYTHTKKVIAMRGLNSTI